MEEQFTRLIVFYLSKETEWQCRFNKLSMYKVVGANTNSSYGKMYGPRSKYRLKSSQLLIAETEKQSTCLNCIIYAEEHNGTILSTYEACIKQLATPLN